MEAATASGGSRGGDENPNKRNKGKEPENPPYNPTTRKRRQTRGRRPIKIERIINEEARLSTFSKRRSGIYNKANEIVTSTGVHLGLVMITPAERAFSFSHSSIEDIINRFLIHYYAQQHQQQQQQQLPLEQQLSVQPLSQQIMMQEGGRPQRINLVEMILEDHRKARVNSMNLTYSQLTELIKAEKEKSTTLVRIAYPFENPDGSTKDNTGGWWELMPNTNLADEDVDRLAEEIRKLTIRIGEIRLMHEHTFTMTSQPSAYKADQSYRPLLTMQGYGYEAGPSYQPPLSIEGSAMDNIFDVPLAGTNEVIPTYNPPPPMPVISSMHGMIGNTDVHEDSSFVGGMHNDEEDMEDLVARYFNNDEGPRAGDF